MAVLRALPSRAWSAVVALVVLASLGVAIVLGAGLDAWRGTVGGPPYGGIGGLAPDRGPGVITLPGGPRPAVDPQEPTTPTTPDGDDVPLGPVEPNDGPPGTPGVDTPEGPGGPDGPGGGGPGEEPPAPNTPGTGHPGRPAVHGPGGFEPLPGTDKPGPAAGKVSCGLGAAMRQVAHQLDLLSGAGHGQLKRQLLQDVGCGDAYGLAKHHGHANHHRHAEHEHGKHRGHGR
jgi:hypothetical protein